MHNSSVIFSCISDQADSTHFTITCVNTHVLTVKYVQIIIAFHTHTHSKRKGHPIVTDQKQRDAVLKQSFSMDKIPPQLDAIVIGSGIGGLSVASILSKVGKKVLVLEQHDQAGGCCHTFIDKGFEFDTGIHYVGEMSEGAFNRVLVDQLSESGIEWEQLEEVYDTVVLGMGQDDPAKRKSFPISSGRGKLMETLIESFPDEEKNIRKYFALLRRLRRLTVMVTVLKALPKCLSHFLISSGIVRRFAPDLVYFERSLSDVLNEVTDNKELKAVLAYSFGDYGTSFNHVFLHHSSHVIVM